ncbi:CK001 protein, partial [Halcyon senegalensis]|nr:CK001 protein [Halcyon senegalensis]
WLLMALYSQYGWRCTTNENDYSTKNLVENWNEEQYDTQRIVQPTTVSSQIWFVVVFFQRAHCFETTYSSDDKMGKHQRMKSTCAEWKHTHHPELEPLLFNATTQSCYASKLQASIWHHFLCLCPILREGTRRMQG